MDRCVLDTSIIIKSFFNKTNKETEDKTRLHTFAKYVELCEKIRESDYTLLT